MSKPQWLKDREVDLRHIKREPDKCVDCIYYGKFVKYAKHRGSERVGVHECDIHPSCFNTRYSICCADFHDEELV